MTAPYMGGYGIARAPDGGAELGQSLSQLGGAIGGIIDPDYKLQKSMEQAIALHPELGQSLADRSYISGQPDYLEKLGLGSKLSEQIRSTPPSSDAHVQMMIQHFLGKQGMDDAGKFNDALNELPPQVGDLFRKHIGIPTGDEQAIEHAKAGIAGSQNTIESNQAQVSSQTMPITQSDIQDHINYLQNPLNPQQAQQIAQSMAAGNGPLPPQALAAMKYDPTGVGKFITDQIAALRANKETTMEGKRLSIETTNQALQYAEKVQTHLNKDYGDMAPVYDKVNNLLGELQKGGDAGKAAMASLPMAMMALDAVRPQARGMMYQYLKSTSPKWTDQLIRKLDSGAYGDIPKEQLNGVIQYFKDQSSDIMGGYDREVKAARKRFPEAGQYLTDTKDAFSNYGSLQPQGATPSIPPEVIQSIKGKMAQGATLDQLKQSQLYKQYGDGLLRAVQ